MEALVRLWRLVLHDYAEVLSPQPPWDLGVWNAVLCNQNHRCLTDTGESTKN